ncbi:hypothetical protein SDC9_163554 [bioreactor metagenome]|uniref:Uncharacterized protein n=1 Tax=bioreactor metagenome TaxID=1076179 RepID=A0A645FR73_9ZZZZ
MMIGWHINVVVIIERRIKPIVTVIRINFFKALLTVPVNIPQRIVQIDKKIFIFHFKNQKSGIKIFRQRILNERDAQDADFF